MAKYKTLKYRSEGEYKEKGSKFYGYAQFVSSEKNAKEFLEQIRNEHHKARHLCYAYKIGIDKDNAIIRTNDDGEPSNTAGMPILNYIKKYDLSFVVIAVVRYFGGVLLGKGGLINAYGTAAEEAIKNGKIIKGVERENLNIDLNFSDFSKVMDILKEKKYKIINQKFDKKCHIKIELPKDDINELKIRLKNFSIDKITV
ncbi:MAG: YigZ family protein [Bacteroidota bacterium]|nr:YigZ family protein [Bacteroidota bacterium]